MGYSAGSALAGLLQMKDKLSAKEVVVIIFHDHGSRYVGKIYNDDWMRERGFIDKELMVRDIIKANASRQLITVSADDKVRYALQLMKEYDISQMPVMKGDDIVGSVSENTILTFILENPMNHADKPVSEIMDDPFPFVRNDIPYTQLRNYFNQKMQAVVTKDLTGSWHIITPYDVIQAV